MQEIIAYSTMALTVGLAVSRPHVGSRWRIGPAQAALAGMSVLLAFGVVTPREIIEAGEDLWRSFVTVACIMAMTGVALQVGLVQALSHRVLGGEGLTVGSMFNRVFLFSVVTSSILNNDAMVLLVTPLAIAAVRDRMPNRPDLLVPFAFAVFAAVGVAPIVVSNPMNMIVADYADIDFNAYASRMVPIALAGQIVAWLVLRRVFARALNDPADAALPSRPVTALAPVQKRVLALLLLVVAAYPVSALIDASGLWIVAMTGAVVALALAWGSGASPVVTVRKHVAVDILLFLFAVFVLALGLRNVGFVDHLSSFYAGSSLATIGVAAAVGSAMLNNHPMAILNLLALEQIPTAGEPEIFAMLIGGDLGPRLLPIGSLAGLLWLAGCRRAGVRVPLTRFVAVGVAVTIPTLAVSLAQLTLLVR